MPEHTEAKSCVQCILYSMFLLGAHGYYMAALHSMLARAALFYDHLAGRTGADRRKQIRGFNPKLKGTIVHLLPPRSSAALQNRIESHDV